MLKTYSLLLVIIFTCAKKNMAQVNLVRNPSFEEYSHCPDAIDEMKYSNFWMSLDSSWSPPDWAHAPWGVPEYCNICATSISAYSIPGGWPFAGYYSHYPRSGNAMVGLQVFYDESEAGTPQLRDFAQGHLISNLIAGQSYCASFYVSLGQASVYAIKNIGAYFDDGTIDTTHNYGLPQNHCSPQIFASTIITDTLNWVRIYGSFIASGTEKIITIGNFSDNSHTSCIARIDTTGFYLGSGGYAWYIVDDISVFRSDAVANAGPDSVIPTTVTDSVIIGDTLDSYLPTYWYANGVKIDSNKAWLKVHPDTTTRYVVGLIKCGGEVSYDTVTVWASTTKNGLQTYKGINAKIYPNPAQDKLTINNALGTSFEIYDMIGKKVFYQNVNSDSETISIENLSHGIYIIQIMDPSTSLRKTMKLVKE